MLGNFISSLRNYTSSLEPWWTIVGAPLTQEIIFRLIPYQFFYLPSKKYYLIGIISSVIYALIHWYFGIPVIIGGFILGVLLWWIMIRFGLLSAIAIHILVNFFILLFWKEQWLEK